MHNETRIQIAARHLSLSLGRFINSEFGQTANKPENEQAGKAEQQKERGRERWITHQEQISDMAHFCLFFDSNLFLSCFSFFFFATKSWQGETRILYSWLRCWFFFCFVTHRSSQQIKIQMQLQMRMQKNNNNMQRDGEREKAAIIFLI